MYVVEYDAWYLGIDKEWRRLTEYWYYNSLREAESEAEKARWNKDVIEDTILVRLMSDKERKAYYVY
jgi:hypothetical protein